MNLPALHKPFLAARKIVTLPAGVPIDLFEIPIVRGTDKLVRDKDGLLPPEAHRQELVLSGRNSKTQVSVVIQGDTVLGRPYGYDARVLLAICVLVRVFGAWDGKIPSPSLAKIGRAMGEDPNDSGVLRRIRASLERLRRVTLVFKYEREIPTVEDILDGAATPEVPGRKRPIVTSSPNEWLIRSTIVELDGELRLDTLELNPVFVGQGVAGSLLFLDKETFDDLDKSLAQRLYSIAAGLRAQAEPAPWVLDMDDLQARCGVSGSGKHFRALIKKAADDLIAAKVLESFTIPPSRRGEPFKAVFSPGELLGVAGLLRGVGYLDPEDVAAHMLVLSEMGCPDKDRRTMVDSEPQRVHWALMYVEFARKCPKDAGLKNGLTSPLGMFKKKMAEPGFENDIAFQRWYRKEYQITSGAAPQKESSKAREPESLVRAPVPPELQVLKDAIRRQLKAQGHEEAAFHLGGLAPDSINDETLILSTRSTTTFDFYSVPATHAALCAAAKVASRGEVHEVAIAIDATPAARGNA